MGAEDWRELLDDPECLVIINQVTTWAGHHVYPGDRARLYQDDMASFLLVEAVRIAKGYRPPPEHDPRFWNPQRSWYAYLNKSLKYAARNHPKAGGVTPGTYGSAKYKATSHGHTLESITEADRETTVVNGQLLAAPADYRDPQRVYLAKERLAAVIDHLQHMDDVSLHNLLRDVRIVGSHDHEHAREVWKIRRKFGLDPTPEGRTCPGCGRPVTAGSSTRVPKPADVEQAYSAAGECMSCLRIRKKREAS